MSSYKRWREKQNCHIWFLHFTFWYASAAYQATQVGDPVGPRASSGEAARREKRGPSVTRVCILARFVRRTKETARSLFFIVPVKYVFRGSYRGILVIRD